MTAVQTKTPSSISREALHAAGFAEHSPADYEARPVTLRDGRDATVWIHRQTGHGILDEEFWEDSVFYQRAYRLEYGPVLTDPTPPEQRLETYAELNDKQFDKLRPQLENAERLLEIGAGAGGIVERCLQHGLEVHAVEPSLADADFLRRKFPAAEVHAESFEEVRMPAGHFDVIASFEVLEHVPSPRAFLEQCHALTKRGGQLCIEVPNHDDVLLSAYQDKAYRDFFYHKAHIHYFTAKSLRQLCSECGFAGRVESVLMYPFFNHVWWQQNGKPQGGFDIASATPQPGTDCAVGRALNAFHARVEREYERLVNALVVGDCLVFRGERT